MDEQDAPQDAPQEEAVEEQPDKQPQSLEQLHREQQELLDNEPQEDQEEPADTGDKSSDDSDGEGENDDEKTDSEVPAVAKQEDVDIDVPELPEVDSDTSKPGQYKVAVKDVDGQTFYFSSIDDVPDDFEPESAKQWGMAVQKFADNRSKIAELGEQREQALAEKTRRQRANKIREGWTEEQNELVESGDLPKDEKKRQPVIDGVYKVITEELEKGTPVGTWKQAYEIYENRRLKAEAKERNEKRKQKKSEQGSKIQSGGTPSPSGRQGREFEPMPAGVTLDEVHSRTLGSL